MKNNFAWIGGLVWVGLGFYFWDGGMQKENYLVWLFLAAPMFLSACALRALGFSLLIQNISLCLGGLLAISFMLPTGSMLAITFALPWLFFSMYLTWKKIMPWWKTKTYDHSMLKVLAPMFMITGASWALFYRADFQPLDFTPTIVLLTGVHFHYAGLILMSLASNWLEEFPKHLQKLFTYAFFIGIPLLAAGITYSHLHGPSLLELIAATWMAGTAFSFAATNIYFRLGKKKTLGNLLILIASLLLMAGMALALLFGWKAILGISWISIPWMYAVHGTINSIGFALPGVMGTSFNLLKNASD